MIALVALYEMLLSNLFIMKSTLCIFFYYCCLLDIKVHASRTFAVLNSIWIKAISGQIDCITKYLLGHHKHRIKMRQDLHIAHSS